MAKLLSAFLISLVVVSSVEGSHIRGGRISYRNISNLAVEITFVGYRDENGVLFGNGLLDLGDGTVIGDEDDEVFQWTEPEQVSSGMEQMSFIITHTYASAGYYTVSYQEPFRSDAINFEESIQSNFFVEAQVAVDPFLNNRSAISVFTPDFTAVAGKKFVTNLAMVDEDGDSLGYLINAPKSDQAGSISYKWPNDRAFYSTDLGNEAMDGPAVIKIDRLTGNLVWDAPGEVGSYALAIRIEEWRKLGNETVLVGYIVFDFLIRVVESLDKPVINLPPTECFDPGTTIEQLIEISNPAKDAIAINLSSEIEGLLVEGQSISDWNEEFANQSFSEELIQLRLELPASASQMLSGFQQSTVHLEDVNEESRFSITQNFAVGIDCTLSDEVVLGGNVDLVPQISFSKGHMRLVAPESGSIELIIFDLRGQELFRTSKQLKQGVHHLNLNSLPESIYNVVFVHKNGILTQKLLLTK